MTCPAYIFYENTTLKSLQGGQGVFVPIVSDKAKLLNKNFPYIF